MTKQTVIDTSDAAARTRTLHPPSPDELGRRFKAVLDRLPGRSYAAETAGRSTDQLAKYVKGTADPPFVPVALLCVEAGVRPEWLATGLGSMVVPPEGASQGVSGEALSIAFELAEEVLTGLWLPKRRYADLVGLIYDALTQGLPYAQILDFARPAARELAQEGGDDVGGTELDDAGQGGTGGREAAATG